MRALIVAVLIAVPRLAAAQLCHVGDVDDATEHATHHHGHAARKPMHVQAMVTGELATIEGGSYQGVTPAVTWHLDRFGARLAVPVWRLDLRDTPYSGVGDVIVQGHARIAGDAGASIGAVVAVGLPTGKSSYGLGMGHVMVMPAVWATAGRGRVLVLLGAGKSLGSGHDHPGFPSGPPVSPMAPFEADATIRASYLPATGLALDAIAALAVPLADDRDPRAAAGLGARWHAGPWQLGASGLLGITGEPFNTRLIVDLARRL